MYAPCRLKYPKAVGKVQSLDSTSCYNTDLVGYSMVIFKTEEFQVRVSLEALDCVYEQDTLSSA